MIGYSSIAEPDSQPDIDCVVCDDTFSIDQDEYDAGTDVNGDYTCADCRFHAEIRQMRREYERSGR